MSSSELSIILYLSMDLNIENYKYNIVICYNIMYIKTHKKNKKQCTYIDKL